MDTRKAFIILQYLARSSAHFMLEGIIEHHRTPFLVPPPLLVDPHPNALVPMKRELKDKPLVSYPNMWKHSRSWQETEDGDLPLGSDLISTCRLHDATDFRCRAQHLAQGLCERTPILVPSARARRECVGSHMGGFEEVHDICASV